MARELPKRKTIRMRGYDHAQQGAYYLTICTDDRRHWFGRIVDGVMHRSPIGELAQQCWDAIPEHMRHVDVDEFVVMPNHVHGIVIIRERLGDVRGVRARHDAPLPDPPATDQCAKPPGIPHGALGQIVASYKSAVTRIAYRDGLLPRGTPVWQQNYYDHIIRNQAEWIRIADYIRDNPANWGKDRFNG